MATSKLIATHLRRTSFSLLRPLLLSLSSSSSPPPPTTTTSSRYFSSSPPSDSHFTHTLSSVTESELRNLGLIDSSKISDVADKLLDDSILPINFIVSFLDGYHDFSGLPWWIVIVSSTVAMRVTLFPWILLQYRKMGQIQNVFPKLPPPFPPLFSGRSFSRQLSIFCREKRALGCPSFLWFVAPWAVQLPCFILCMTSVRRMSLDQYPGFDIGGTLWFQNLSEVPNGLYGPILPLLIAGLHFSNVQPYWLVRKNFLMDILLCLSAISLVIYSLRVKPSVYALPKLMIGFRSLAESDEGLFHSLAKCYKMYLDLLTLPLLFVGFHIPQGSLVYWVSNSSLTLIQQLCLKNPAIRQKLGLQQQPGNVEESATPVPDAPKKRSFVNAFDLSPLELVNVAVTYLTAGRFKRALELVRLAVEQDPRCFMAWCVMGQIMMKQNEYQLATEYFECAISEIMSLAKPTDEAIDFLILASIDAGAAYYQQGKVAESFVHLERLRDMEVPEEPIGRGRYCEGLVLYASFLDMKGRRDEAVKLVRMASEYNPQYSVYLEKLENDADSFVSDLANSRRADY